MPLRQPVVNNLTKPMFHNDMERFSLQRYIFFLTIPNFMSCFLQQFFCIRLVCKTAGN